MLPEGVDARKGRAVYPRKHLVLLVPSPVGAGEGEELECRYHASGRQVRPAAKIGEPVLGVEAHRLVCDAADELDFERFTLFLEEVDRLFPLKLVSADGEVPVDDLPHLSFYFREVFLGEAGLVVEVIIETRLYGGPDGDLRFRVERFDRLGHDVGRAVAEDGRSLGRIHVDGLDLPSRTGADRSRIRSPTLTAMMPLSISPMLFRKSPNATRASVTAYSLSRNLMTNLTPKALRNQKASDDALVEDSSGARTCSRLFILQAGPFREASAHNHRISTVFCGLVNVNQLDVRLFGGSADAFKGWLLHSVQYPMISRV